MNRGSVRGQVQEQGLFRSGTRQGFGVFLYVVQSLATSATPKSRLDEAPQQFTCCRGRYWLVGVTKLLQ